MPMYEIDRIVAIVRPTEALLAWLQDHMEDGGSLTMDDLHQDTTAVLIPLFEDPTQAQAYINEIYEDIINNELSSWEIPENKWPESITLELFWTWFDVNFHSMVYDGAAGEVVEAEEVEEEDHLLFSDGKKAKKTVQ